MQIMIKYLVDNNSVASEAYDHNLVGARVYLNIYLFMNYIIELSTGKKKHSVSWLNPAGKYHGKLL